MNSLPKDSMPAGYEIPDEEILFRFYNPVVFPTDQDEIPVAIFQDKELSCDWQHFRPDPKTSYHIAEGKNRVVSILICEQIRNPTNPKRIGQKVAEWKQQIIYNPITAEQDTHHGENTAHSLIVGLKKAAVCEALKENSTWKDY